MERAPLTPVTLFYGYYNQTDMLAKQVTLWRSYPKALLEKINIILIDDCSSSPAMDVLAGCDISGLPLEVYRVGIDLYCNIGGTRNLSVKLAKTEWMLFLDMDLMISPTNLELIMKIPFMAGKADGELGEGHRMYKFNRRRPDGSYKIHPAACLFQREVYWKVGGCDEDFVGNYGQTDVHFFHRARGVAEVVIVQDIVIEEDADGNTATIDRSKEKLRPNLELLEHKKAEGNWSTDYVRFPWSKVYQST